MWVGVKPKSGIWSADPTCLEEIANLKMRIWAGSSGGEVECGVSKSLKGGHRKSAIIRKEKLISIQPVTDEKLPYLYVDQQE